MIPLLFFVAASADLDTLDQAVARCDRGVANPAFSNESARRSEFLLGAYREQEQIVTARLDLAQRRRDLREASAKKNSAEEQKLTLEEAAIEDRQSALNDQRMDWREDDFAAGFVFDNPNATGSCGCGESFTV